MIQRIINRFKKPEKVTVHPKFGNHIQYAFTCNGTNYYRLLNDDEVYKDRFPYLVKFSNECNMKLTSDDIIKFMDEILNECNVGLEKKTISLTNIVRIADNVKYRAEWLFEPESLYRLASVVYFDLGENIKIYDFEYNKNKIELFKKKGEELLRYLLQKILGGSHPFLNLSLEDSVQYLSLMEDHKKKEQRLTSSKKSSMQEKQQGKETSK